MATVSNNPAPSLRLLTRSIIVLALWLSSVAGLAGDWPRFRGPNGSGVADAQGLPVGFGPGSNLLWKTEAPLGSSSPIIAGNRVWLTGFKAHQLLVCCFDRTTGQRLWERTIEEARSERKSPPNDAASSTPVTDGRNVYALFSGLGLISYTSEGAERWRTPLGPFSQPHGMSSSPVLADGAVIIVADQVTDSYVAAFEAESGNVRWKRPRPNFVGGYSTPLVCGGQIVVAGPLELVAYAAANGQRLWAAPKMGVMPIGSPVCEGNLFYVNNGAVPPFEALAKDLKADRNGDGKLTPEEFPDPSFKEAVLAIDRVYGNGDGAVDKAEWDGALKLMQTLNALVAVRAQGTNSTELWRITKALPDVSSPLLYQNVLYLLKDGGILTSVNPANGQVLKRDRLEGATERYFASPVAADDKIYAVSEAGKIAVVQPGAQWRLLTINDLGEQCYATPALAAGEIVVRSSRTLWAFGNRGSQR